MSWPMRGGWKWVGLAVLVACGGEPPSEGVTAPSGSVRPALVATPWGMDSRPSNPTCVAPFPAPDPYGITLQRVFPALQFRQPVLLVHSPAGASRWYVLEREGVVRVFDDTPAVQTSSVAFDLRSKTHVKINAGLLGMTFHPRFEENGYVYLVYTGFGGPTNLRLFLSRFVSHDGGQTFDPASEQVLLRLDKHWEDHNGGHLAFGEDGYLYFGIGDGGSPQDSLNNAQDPDQLFGKMLRLDVDGDFPYGIPPTNPFARGGGRPEIYALGFRNPWGWSFDRQTGDLWLGDVGESSAEEVNKVILGGNYGWPLKEGLAWFRGSADTAPPLVDPEYVYPHTDGFAIVGGYVYRGRALPSLYGKYVFADYSFGRLWFLSKSPATGTNEAYLFLEPQFLISALAEDLTGELYVLDHQGGGVYKLVPETTLVRGAARRLSETGCVEPSNPRLPSPGLVPYDIAAPLWSDWAVKKRFIGIPDGTGIGFKPNGHWDFPPGTVLMKTFELDGRMVETRLLLRHPNGIWRGYSYEWLEDQSDALLLNDGKTTSINGRTWTYPSRGECMQCHTEVVSRVIGLETGQMNRFFVYPGERISNQLETLNHIGMFKPPMPQPAWVYPAHAPSYDWWEPLELRVRSHLHTNCANCHQPGGTTQTTHDLRYDTPLSRTGLCDVEPRRGDLGVPGARLLVPGHPEQSVLWLRMRTRGPMRMPPLGSHVVDGHATRILMEPWIRSMTECPEP